VRLTKLSRERSWNVYTDIAWPEALTGERYCMAPELMSIWGTEHWDTLTEEQRVRLSLYECANFFSLTLQGERPLVAGHQRPALLEARHGRRHRVPAPLLG
jgi:hypothetical protein